MEESFALPSTDLFLGDTPASPSPLNAFLAMSSEIAPLHAPTFTYHSGNLAPQSNEGGARSSTFSTTSSSSLLGQPSRGREESSGEELSVDLSNPAQAQPDHPSKIRYQTPPILPKNPSSNALPGHVTWSAEQLDALFHNREVSPPRIPSLGPQNPRPGPTLFPSLSDYMSSTPLASMNFVPTPTPSGNPLVDALLKAQADRPLEDHQSQQTVFRIEPDAHAVPPSTPRLVAPRVTQRGHDEEVVDLTPFLNLPQKEAADQLRVPVSTLSKKWNQVADGRKWPYRTVNKLDKEIMTLMHNIPSDGKMPPRIESELGRLLHARSLELRPVKVRLARKDFIQQARAKAAQQHQQAQPQFQPINLPQLGAPEEEKEDD